MNIYKAPNLIISPERKVYRRWVGGGINDESIYTLTHLSLSLTHTHLSQCQEEQATETGKDASLEQI